MPYIDIKKVMQCYRFILLWQQNHQTLDLHKKTLFSKLYIYIYIYIYIYLYEEREKKKQLCMLTIHFNCG